MLTTVQADHQSDLASIIEHAAHFLPCQGPIEVFVHHNTLHAFENMPFHAAVRQARRLHAADPYLSEAAFRQLLASGRITSHDLRSVLLNDKGEGNSSDYYRLPEEQFGTRFDLRLAMLQHPIHRAPPHELRWVMAETDALTRFRGDVEPSLREVLMNETRQEVERTRSNGKLSDKQIEARTLERLWESCCRGVEQCDMEQAAETKSLRPRDGLLLRTGTDADWLTHQLLIPFTAAFVDQGYADTPLPGRDAGFLNAFIDLYCNASSFSDAWLQPVTERVRRLRAAGDSPLESIAHSLRAFGIEPQERAAFILQSLLALPGWSGMLQQLEHAPNWVDRPVPAGSLVEFLAVRLLLDEAAVQWVAQERLGRRGLLSQLGAKLRDDPNGVQDIGSQIAFEIFQIAQVMGWSIPSLEVHLAEVIREIQSFDEIDRRRLFQEAFELHFRRQALDAIQSNFQHAKASVSRPVFQVCCCIDDREESFRRHLEEVAPKCETFGAAGFFAVAMYYRGVSEAAYKPLCPAPVTPAHYVKENVGYTFSGNHAMRARARQRLGQWTHQVHSGSHTFVGGMATSLLGSLAAFPLVARVLFPRLTSQLRRLAGRLVQPPQVTQLQLERYEDPTGPEDGHVGYSVVEMVDVVQRLLEDIGLTNGFAKLVVIVGHGSSSVNNPHSSAYNCGACAGKRGGPNARAFASMANDFRVRSVLLGRGIRIPSDTWFLGAYHNTCDDSLGWFDLDRMPPSHHQLFESTKRACDEASLRNAHERSRRFQDAALHCSSIDALRHVQQRSEDLSQVRPEYNHATNAMCLVGRRRWSRSLFLDRRAFLTSYDPSQDDESGTILARILAAAIPVCAGISLEYYFSCVDSTKYGAGSKLPHNLVSLLGVMEGAASDLRTGLYQQMVEIHEPMRLLFVVETEPEIMLQIIQDNQAIERLCSGHWVQLAVLSPATGKLMQYRNSGFEAYQATSDHLPHVSGSKEWYAGKRGNLGFARIEAQQ